jgi:hypothetical protein
VGTEPKGEQPPEDQRKNEASDGGDDLKCSQRDRLPDGGNPVPYQSS